MLKTALALLRPCRHEHGRRWHALSYQQERQHGLHHVRVAQRQDGMPEQPVGLDGLHELPLSHEHGAAADAGARRRERR